MNQDLTSFFLVLLLISSSFLFGFLVSDYLNEIKLTNNNGQTIEKNKTYNIECKGLGLEETAHCMVEQIMPYYNYTKTKDSIDLTLKELKNNGGDCRDWTLLYQKRTPDGYYGTFQEFKTSEKKGHAYYVLSNEEGYCILDLINNPVCKIFK